MLAPVDSVCARGRVYVRSTRLVTGYHLVAALDQMVAGLAGGDQETAAVFVGDDHRDELERIR